MTHRRLVVVFVMLFVSFAGAANAAPKLDPELSARLALARPTDQFGVILTFEGDQVTQSQVEAVRAPGASMKDGRIAGFSSRGIFGDPVVHPTVLTPGTGGPADQGFTSAIIATRAKTNAVATGLDADAEIPPAFVPYYTQISGTSMACPHLAGIIANILEANPSLLPDDVKAILERTATPLATYDQFEAGAGLANVHAAVDLAFNRQKPYGDFGFTGKGLALSAQDGGVFTGTVASGSSATHTFSVPANARFTFVQLDWDGSIVEGDIVIDNTKLAINDLALTVLKNNSQVAKSDEANLAALFGSREAVKIEFPSAGAYTARVSSGFPAGAGQVTDQSYRVTVTVQDVSGQGGTYNLCVANNRDLQLGGVSVNTTTQSVTVPPNGSASFTVNATIDGNVIRDTMAAKTVGNQVVFEPIQMQWYVVAERAGGGETLRMPFYLKPVPTVPAAAAAVETEPHAGTLVVGDQNLNTLSPVTHADFTVKVTDATLRVNATLDFPAIVEGNVPDLDLFAYDPDGNEVTSSTNGGGPESLSFIPARLGDYTIRVSG
jgi:hypothetical protein